MAKDKKVNIAVTYLQPSVCFCGQLAASGCKATWVRFNVNRDRLVNPNVNKNAAIQGAG